MAEASLIEDIVTTKNTLTILRQVFTTNRTLLQPFSSVFDSISTLLHIFTHTSVKQIEKTLQSNESQAAYFRKLRETLNELSNAISTNNSSTIDRLKGTLDTYVGQLRADGSSGTVHEETADANFQKQLLQSSIHDLLDSFEQLAPLCQAAVVSIAPARLPSAMKPRLMISYNHASKPLCTDIYDRLTQDGYDVWIDFKEMHGSTLVAMAQAIENAEIILFCVTESYSTSPNCQKEAEYAFVREKLMIPLLLQSKYKPTGWLGFLLGASFYIDFTKNDFAQNYKKLKSEIAANAVRITGHKNDVVKLKPDSTPVNGEASNKEATAENISRSCVLFK